MKKLSIEGFAIVSVDGKIAGADGVMPESLKFEEDQAFLDAHLSAARLLIHGRNSHEGQAHSAQRRRLVVTSRCETLEQAAPNVWHWNPARMSLRDVCALLCVEEGIVAILGGTRVYDMFLPLYTKFHLCRAVRVEIGGGLPLFSGGRSVEDRLRAAGLRCEEEVTLSERHALLRQVWARSL